MRNRIVNCIVIAIISFITFFFCKGTCVIAEDQPFELSTYNIEINLPDYLSYYEYGDGEGGEYNYDTPSVEVDVLSSKCVSAVSSDESLVEVDLWYYSNKQVIYIRANYEKIGKGTITCTDSKGQQQIINVSVTCPFSVSPSSLTINSGWAKFEEGEYGYIDWNNYGYYTPLLKTNNVLTDITQVVSSNTKVVTVSKENYEDYRYIFRLIPKGVGSATLTLTDSYGQTTKCPVKVTNNYIQGDIKYYTEFYSERYGDSISGHTKPGAQVRATIKGKKYLAVANQNGDFSMSVPVFKIGTKVYYSITYGGTTTSINSAIKKPKTSVSTSTVYRKTKKMTVTIKNAHKGDKVTVKVGKKYYKKKIKKNYKKYKYKIKLKSKKAGDKIKITVKNKYKQKIASKSGKVYYASSLKKGMTKKQCKLVPGWSSPDDETVSGSYTTWWFYEYDYYTDYDEDGNEIEGDEYISEYYYLEFYRGRLYGWGHY